MLTEEQLTKISCRVAKRHLQNHKAALKHLSEELRAAGYKQVSSEEFDAIEGLVREFLHVQAAAGDVLLAAVITFAQLNEDSSDNSN